MSYLQIQVDDRIRFTEKEALDTRGMSRETAAVVQSSREFLAKLNCSMPPLPDNPFRLAAGSNFSCTAATQFDLKMKNARFIEDMRRMHRCSQPMQPVPPMPPMPPMQLGTKVQNRMEVDLTGYLTQEESDGSIDEDGPP